MQGDPLVDLWAYPGKKGTNVLFGESLVTACLLLDAATAISLLSGTQIAQEWAISHHQITGNHSMDTAYVLVYSTQPCPKWASVCFLRHIGEAI